MPALNRFPANTGEEASRLDLHIAADGLPARRGLDPAYGTLRVGEMLRTLPLEPVGDYPGRGHWLPRFYALSTRC